MQKENCAVKLYPIECGNFKLDGGAMFGVVPKTIWSKTNPADERNMIELTMRCLLIENGNRLILIDTGIGNKQPESFFRHYYLWGEDTLDNSLKKAGFHRDDITDVFLTHLHFDHCGGSVQWNSSRTSYEPTFKNALFWSNQAHWEWATRPNAREKASFLPENILPIQESGQLRLIPILGTGNYQPCPELGFDILFVNGHTEKQMLPHLHYQGKTIVFAADLIPTVGHIPLPYIMGYDTRPLLTLEEKAEFLQDAAINNYFIFLEHDPYHEICTLQQTEKKVALKETYSFRELSN